jgi:hypothetical protein
MIKKNYVHPHICICRKCEGTGKISSYREEDILRNDPTYITCDQCNGNGRVVVKKITTTTITAYDSNKDVCLQ